MKQLVFFVFLANLFIAQAFGQDEVKDTKKVVYRIDLGTTELEIHQNLNKSCSTGWLLAAIQITDSDKLVGVFQHPEAQKKDNDKLKEKSKDKQETGEPKDIYRKLDLGYTPKSIDENLKAYQGEGWQLICNASNKYGNVIGVFKRPNQPVNAASLASLQGKWGLKYWNVYGAKIKDYNVDDDGTQALLNFEGNKFTLTISENGKKTTQAGTIQHVSENNGSFKIDMLIEKEDKSERYFTVRTVFFPDPKNNQLYCLSGGLGSARPEGFESAQEPTLPSHARYQLKSK